MSLNSLFCFLRGSILSELGISFWLLGNTFFSARYYLMELMFFLFSVLMVASEE